MKVFFSCIACVFISTLESSQPHTVYYYCPDGKNSTTIEHYSEEFNNSLLHVCHIENRDKTTYLYYDPAIKRLTAELSGDNHKINRRRFFSYDSEGSLTSILIDDGTSTNPKDMLDVHEQHLITCTNAPVESKNSDSTQSSSRIWDLWKGICNIGKTLFNKIESSQNYLKDVKQELAYSEYIKDEMDYALHQTFSESFLQLAGYYQDTSHIGVFNPNQEISDKVRITLINGILTVKEDLICSLEQFSISHGNNTIHYVFHSTEGWTDDLFDSAYVKMGYVSQEAHLLAKLWKNLIAEMGGPQAGGVIFHYAHSIGATNTFTAKDLLSPEERAMIHVVTMGSPTMIPENTGFASVINYASKRDVICAIDLKKYINCWLKNDGNIELLGSFFEMPLIEHTLNARSYSEIIELLGKQFVENYH